MIVGPASTTITSVDSNGYAVVADVSSLYEGVFFWLSKTGQTSIQCVVTEINRSTKTIGIRNVTAASGRSDLTNYDGGTIDIYKQLWSNPNGPTFGDIVVQNTLVVNNSFTSYGLIYPAQYATGDLPSAASNEGAIAYDSTTNEFKYSDGSSWTAAGGGGGVTTMAAIGATPNANGASISGVTLTLQPASASYGGILTTGTQTIAGKKVLSTAFSSPTVAQTTTATVTLAVTSAGSDAYNIARDPISGGDYSATPFLTLQAAIDACPRLLKHSIFINIGAGSFAGAMVSGFTGGGVDADGNKIGVYITGHTANITPTTGVATGTAGAGTSTTSVVKPTATANWTASDLVDYLFIPSGGAGYVSATMPIIRPIKANNTTTLTVDAIAGMDDTTTFNICQPDTIIEEIGVSDLTSIRAAYNTCPIVVRLIKTQGNTGTLDYGVYSTNNNAIELNGCMFDEATTFETVYSLKDSDVAINNISWLNGTEFKADYTAKYIECANNWINTSGPISLNYVLNGKVTKLDSDSAPGYVLQAINMNSLQAEVDANNGDATPVYLEGVGAFEAIGSNKLTGSGNTGTGCYGIEIQKSGRLTLIGSDVTGDDGDVYFQGNVVTWATLTSPSYGIVETYSGNAVGNGSYTKSITYGPKLFNSDIDFAGRCLEYGYHNFSTSLTVPTLTGTDEYDMSANSALGFLQIACNSATATVVLPANAAIAGCQVVIYNSGTHTLTVEPPAGGAIDGGASTTIASGKTKTFWSLNGASGKNFIITAST